MDAFVKECTDKIEAKRQQEEDGVLSKRKQKNENFWAKKREKAAEKRAKKGFEREKVPGKDKAAQLSEAQIEKAKARFQEKKARRLARKEAAEAATEEATPRSSVPLSKKERGKAEQ